MSSSALAATRKMLTGRHASRNKGLGEGNLTQDSTLSQLMDIFPDWSEEDLSLALAECAGDLELVITRISEGHVSQWSQSNATSKNKRNSAKEALPFTRNHLTRMPHTRSSRSVPTKQNDLVPILRPNVSGITSMALESEASVDHVHTGADIPVPNSQSAVLVVAGSGDSSSLECNPKHTQTKPAKRYTSIKTSLGLPTPSEGQQQVVELGAALSDKHNDKAPFSEIHVETSMKKLVSAIIEDEPLPSLSTPVLPVLQMPLKLSSRMPKAAIPVQPAVVLPIKAALKVGIPVSFGEKLTKNTQFSDLSLQYDNGPKPVDSLTAKQTRYTSTGVETASSQQPRESNHTAPANISAASLAQENMMLRRNHPIHRLPNYSNQRESYLNAPPGLTPSETDATLASDFQSYGKRFQVDEINDSAPGFSHYYSPSLLHSQHQTLNNRTPYNGQVNQMHTMSPYSRSMESMVKQNSISDRLHSASTTVQGTHSHWANAFALPPPAPGNYYQDTHFSQHVYQDSVPTHLSSGPVNSVSPYILHHQHSPQYSQQSSTNSRYNMIQQQQVYQGSQTNYSSHGYDHFASPQYSIRPTHPGTRQNFFPKGNI